MVSETLCTNLPCITTTLTLVTFAKVNRARYTLPPEVTVPHYRFVGKRRVRRQNGQDITVFYVLDVRTCCCGHSASGGYLKRYPIDSNTYVLDISVASSPLSLDGELQQIGYS